MFNNKRILVTGGTGSLGKALMLRAQEESWDCEFVIFSRDETKQSQLKALYPHHTYVLGDVAKYRDIKRAMQDVNIVFHFAAYKQIPAAQNNVPATIETNIIGSQNIVDVAIEENVERVVASSTDKAMLPANLYGASKSVMEALFQHGNKFGKTTFHLARYGNVISSNASVIPLFKKQAQAGGPLTITDKRMTRFWITLDEAIDLILLALKQDPGVIVVPKAPAMSVFDLAKAVGGDLPIQEIGIRPGEKLHEGMVSEPESFHTTEDEQHFFIYPPTTAKVHHNTPFEYTSDNPVRVLSAQEILNMIKYTQERFGQ